MTGGLCTGTFLSHITPDNHLLSTYACIVESRYLNEHDIGIPAKQTSSLDPAGPKYSVSFLLILSPFPNLRYTHVL